MPEGDTLARTAAGLRPFLVGREVSGARAHAPGPRVELLVGSTVTGIDAVGKNLLIRFDNGLEVRTHLRMRGSWHRYRPGEAWRRPAGRASLVLEVPGTVAVCFDAPVVELFEQRAERLHPPLARLGPDLLDPAWGPALAGEAIRRLRDPARADLAVGEAIVDQRALAGIGNVYKSETLFIERINPWTRVGDLSEATLERLVATAHGLLAANADRRPGPERTTTRTAGPRAGGPLWVYGRAGRPCRRCGSPIRRGSQGSELPRLTYWCPRCQGGV